jgi:hypothetical protein
VFKEASSYIESSLSTALVLGIVLHHAKTLKTLVKHRDIVSSLREVGSSRGGFAAQALSRITEEDHKYGRPLSTAVVVGDEGRPGQGFFSQARKLGYNVGETESEESSFWNGELIRMGVSRRFIPGALERNVVPERISHLAVNTGLLHSEVESGEKERTLVTPDLDVDDYEKRLQDSKTKWAVDHPPDMSRYSHVYIPAGQLRVGDRVLLPKNRNDGSLSTFLRRMATREADLKEVTVVKIHNSGESIQWESSENRTYRMPTLGVHVKIRAREV